MPAGRVEYDDTVELDLAHERYTEGEVLGVGGMGKVWLAHDTVIGRHVAVKQLRGDLDLSADQRARFLREARVQGQLEHPSIVPVYDIDRRPDGSTFFTMRRVHGRTLHAILDELRDGGTRYTQRELLTAFATVCLTIDYAHTRGVIHRDLKPANIMLGDFAEVYVLDWGIARVVEGETGAANPRLSAVGEMMGTPIYMAPEQMTDPAVGPEADVFALGAILFEILTLKPLRELKTLYLPAEARPSIRAPHLGIAPELEAICVRATQSLPEDRYPSARALQEAVARYLEGDREIELRRARANEHARAAREALARGDADGDHDREQRTAIRELSRALALDPTNEEHVATFAQIMQAPPRTVPAEVTEQLFAQEQQVVRAAARYSVFTNVSWFLFLPIVIAMGLREPMFAVLILVPVALSAAIAAVAGWVLRTIPYSVQLAIYVFAIAGIVATSSLFGPLLLLPQLLVAITIVVQVHPRMSLRIIAVAIAMLGFMVPVLLEVFGISQSYVFEGGTFTVVPQAIDLPRDLTLLVLFGASALCLGFPVLYINNLRRALTEAQLLQLQQAWQFRRVSDELIGSRLGSNPAIPQAPRG